MPTKTLFVGVDVSLKSNQACAMNFNQDIFFNSSFSNSPSGSDSLVSKLVEVFNKNKNLENIHICMESTGLYHVHVASYLSSDPRLIHFHTKVYTVNPKTISLYKASYVDLEKTDPVDAILCADFIRVGRCQSLIPYRGYQKIALQRATRQRKHVAELLAKEKQYLSTNLFLKFSALSVEDKSCKPFSNTFGKTSMVLLNDYLSYEEIINADLDELVDVISLHSKNRCSHPEVNAKAFDKMVRDSYRLDKLACDSVSVAIASSFSLIKLYQDSIKSLDKQIEKLIKGYNSNYYQSLISIPGIGPVIAAGIIAEIEDTQYFKSQKNFASYAGLRWKRKDSGSKQSEHKKETKACNTYLRYYLVEATAYMIKHINVYSIYYHKKCNEVKINKHKRALVLTSRKSSKLIFGLLCRNQLFDPRSLESNF